MRSIRKIQVIPFIVILVGLVGCPRAPVSSAPPPRRPVTFSGVITDVSTGSPLPLEWATVVANPAGVEVPSTLNEYGLRVEHHYREAVTSKSGEFRFEVEPGRYEVTIYYLDSVWERVIDVRKPTVMRQTIDSTWVGAALDCTSESVSSCGTPEQLQRVREFRASVEEYDRLRAEEWRVYEAEKQRATEAAAEAERQRATEQEKADNARLASNRTKQGLAFLAESVFDSALEEFLAAYELAPVPQGLYHLGLAYEGLKDRTSALDAYKRYLDAAPDGADADDARKRIAKLTKELKKK